MRNNIKNYVTIILFPCILLGLFGPLEIYLSQYDWFWFGIDELLKYVVCATLLLIVCAVIIVFIINKKEKVCEWLATGVFSISFATYIQGTYLRTGFGVMTGEEINWSDYRVDIIISAVLYIAILVIIFFITKKYGSKAIKGYGMVSVGLLIIICFTLIVLLIEKKPWISREEIVATKDGEFDFSKNENIAILIIDSLDARYINEVLESSDYGEKLDGFVYYDNSCPLYNGTDYSVPEILTGLEYYNDREYGDYLGEAYQKSWIAECKNAGWNVTGYLGDIFMTRESTEGIFDNYRVRSLGVSSHKRLLQYMYRLVAFRYAPTPIKRYFEFYTGDMKDLVTIHVDGEKPEDVFTWENLPFYNDICNAKAEVIYDSKVLKMYYIKGLHYLIKFDDNFVTDDSIEYTPQKATIAMLKLVDEFCQRLKEADIYDKTTIIVMGDHGTYTDSKLLSSPVFMIKEVDKHGSVTKLDGELHYEDVSTIFKNISLKKNYLDDVNLSPRERFFFDVEWTENIKANSKGDEMREYIVPSDTKDFDSISPTGKIIGVY